MTLRVTIKDRDSLQLITIKQIKKYIESKGWFKKEDISRTYADQEPKVIAELYTCDTGPTLTSALVIPVSEEYKDYTSRVSEIIFALEKKENRSQLDIYVDITQKSVVVRPNKII